MAKQRGAQQRQGAAKTRIAPLSNGSERQRFARAKRSETTRGRGAAGTRLATAEHSAEAQRRSTAIKRAAGVRRKQQPEHTGGQKS